MLPRRFLIAILVDFNNSTDSHIIRERNQNVRKYVAYFLIVFSPSQVSRNLLLMVLIIKVALITFVTKYPNHKRQSPKGS